MTKRLDATAVCIIGTQNRRGETFPHMQQRLNTADVGAGDAGRLFLAGQRHKTMTGMEKQPRTTWPSAVILDKTYRHLRTPKFTNQECSMAINYR